MDKIMERINNEIDKEAMKYGLMGTETVGVTLEITEKERNEFLENDLNEHWDWEIERENGKIILNIGYTEDIGENEEEDIKMDLHELLEQYCDLTKEEVEFIQTHEKVESCEYMGLEQGHEGDYLYHVTIEGDEEVYSITTNEI